MDKEKSRQGGTREGAGRPPKKPSEDKRTRHWTFILYPDSAPDKWRNILDSEHIQWIESPLHEGEINPDGEGEKKKHWHVLLLFEGKKSYEQIKEISDKLNATIPQVCKNAKGLVRYFAHLDNPEKKQYSTSDIIGHGGADVAFYLKATGSERYQLIREMMDYVRKYNVCEISDLVYFAMENRFDDWFPLLCDNSAYVMGAVIQSNRHKQQAEQAEMQDYVQGRRRKIDLDTGEIIE